MRKVERENERERIRMIEKESKRDGQRVKQSTFARVRKENIECVREKDNDSKKDRLQAIV